MTRPIYYRRRPLGTAPDFEVGYWGVVTDPDGQRRDLAAERDRKVEDLRDEIAFVDSLPRGRLLDVGCGLGHLLSAVDPGWERHGVELSAYAADKARAHGTIFHGTLREARYPDGWFDAITLYHVVEHMTEPEAELREIRRVLRPGGHLVVGTPDFDSALARRFGERFRLLHDVTHVSLFSTESLRRLLEDLGFSVDRVEHPFFDTRYFSRESLERLFDTSRTSPPFHGNIVTIYARRPERSAESEALAVAGRALWNTAALDAGALDAARALAARTSRLGGALWIAGDDADARAAHALIDGLRAMPVTGDELPEGAGPDDLLLAVGADAPRALLADARALGLATVVITTDADVEADADVVVGVPAAGARAAALAARLLVDLIVEVAAPAAPAPRPGASAHEGAPA